MSNTLVVKNMDGNDIRINVIDIVEDTELNKSYICYTVGEMDTVYISRLVEEGDSYSLETVTDEEKANVEEALSENEVGE